jgi:ABC-type nitrate/sulfonate/bicarbonate transport system substrate-binding protein
MAWPGRRSCSTPCATSASLTDLRPMSQTLRAIWFIPPAVHRAAERHGYLAAAGIDVEGVLTRSSDQQFEELRDGLQDAAVTAMDNVIHWNRRGGGGDFRIVAQVEADTGNTLVAAPGIGSISELAGKRLLVDSAENGFVVVLRALLADAGVDFDACTIIRAGGVKERLDAMLAGEGDGTLLGPPFIELGAARGLRSLAVASESYPTFPGQGIVVRASFIEQHGKKLEAWLAALEQGRAECRRDPAAVAQHIAAAGVPKASAEQLAGFVGKTLGVSRAGVELLIAQRRRLGLMGGDTAFDDLVDEGPMERVLARLTEASRTGMSRT